MQASADRGAYARSAWIKKAVAEANKLDNRVGPVACAQVSLPAGAGVRCALTVKAQGGGNEAAVLYFLQHRNATYSLTFTAPPSQGRERTALRRRSAVLPLHALERGPPR